MLGPEQGDASYNLGPGRHCSIQNRRALPHSSAHGSWNLAYLVLMPVPTLWGFVTARKSLSFLHPL